MSEMMANARASVALHKLAIARFCCFVIFTLCTAIMTALAGTNWANVDSQTRFLIVVSIVGSVTSTIMAFFDQSIKRATDGKDPLTGASLPPFATQAQVDAGISSKTIVSPATLAHLPAVQAADEQLPKIP